MTKFYDAKPHGQISEIFPDVHFVQGTATPTFDGGEWQFSRNMTILKDGDALTLVNTVRLDDAGLNALDALGKVKNVVKLGAFHGMDDAFYKDRYDAKQWALEGMTHEGGHETDHVLKVGGETPVPNMSVFVWNTEGKPEGLLLLAAEGGILVSCDSLQNWAEVDQFFSKETAEKMTAVGFIKPANVGPGWARSAKPETSDFERVKALEFKHLVPAHGTPLKNEAKAQLSATFAAMTSEA